MLIRKEIIPANCQYKFCPYESTCCKLSTEVCYTKDSEDIDFAIIGMGAGKKEDIGLTPINIHRQPFYGLSGNYLRHLIKYIFDQGKQFNFILSNIVRFHPIDNLNKDRPPIRAEISRCIHVLIEDLKQYNTKYLIPVGACASTYLLNIPENTKISYIRGRKYYSSGYSIIPTYHPRYLLSNYGFFNSVSPNPLDRIVMNDILKTIP